MQIIHTKTLHILHKTCINNKIYNFYTLNTHKYTKPYTNIH